jgi:hypothetical protein
MKKNNSKKTYCIQIRKFPELAYTPTEQKRIRRIRIRRTTKETRLCLFLFPVLNIKNSFVLLYFYF